MNQSFSSTLTLALLLQVARLERRDCSSPREPVVSMDGIRRSEQQNSLSLKLGDINKLCLFLFLPEGRVLALSGRPAAAQPQMH